MKHNIYRYLVAFILIFPLGIVNAAEGLLAIGPTINNVAYLYYVPATTGTLPSPSVIQFDIVYSPAEIEFGNLDVDNLTATRRLLRVSSTHSLHVVDTKNGLISGILAPKTGKVVVPEGVIATIPYTILPGAADFLNLRLQNIQLSDGITTWKLRNNGIDLGAEIAKRNFDGDGDGIPDFQDLYPNDPLRNRWRRLGRL